LGTGASGGIVAVLAWPVEGHCQQSLFNVPAGLVTPMGKAFVQEQLTLSQHEGESNTSLAYGLSPWLEVGLNVLHVPLYRAEAEPGSGLHTNSVLAHASVSLKPASWATVFIGGAVGVGESSADSPNLVTQGWALTRLEAPGRWGSYVAGAYLGTSSAIGNGASIGGLLGIEIPIVTDRLSFLGDWVIGNNSISVAVVGLVAFLGPRLQISAGFQLPSPGTYNPFGGVLELTYVPIAETRGRH
jgi:hypothetical protein